MANNTYQTIWNPILNALPKAERGPYKLLNIAQPERQKVGTNSFRILNVYSITAPLATKPWITTPSNTSTFVYFTDTANPDNFYSLSVQNNALTLTFMPGQTGPVIPFIFQDTATGLIWQVTVQNGVLMVTQTTGSGIASYNFVDEVTSLTVVCSVQNGSLTLTTT